MTRLLILALALTVTACAGTTPIRTVQTAKQPLLRPAVYAAPPDLVMDKALEALLETEGFELTRIDNGEPRRIEGVWAGGAMTADTRVAVEIAGVPEGAQVEVWAAADGVTLDLSQREEAIAGVLKRLERKMQLP